MTALAFEDWGGPGAPLVLLHGFTGTRAAWDHLRTSLSPRFRGIAVDLPGHGGSPLAAGPGFAETVAALLQLLDSLQLARTDILGYSLGARVALGLAVRAPGRVRRLVLESGSPGFRRPRERAERRRADAELAASILRGGVERFVGHWEGLPLFAGVRALPPAAQDALRSRRLSGTAEGLAGSLRALGTGAQPNLWPLLCSMRVPTLLLTGERDSRFTEVARRMASELPVVWRHVLAGAGHAPHLEVPEAYAAEVIGFLEAPELDSPLVEHEQESNR